VSDLGSFGWRVQEDAVDQNTLLQVRFHEPLKAVTPEQAFVMYDGDVCLGSALVQHSGPTIYEHNTAADSPGTMWA